tara:strand:- start:732 stop:884 length:153 start_codon:yes stop_codon:yes gene_type:complete
LYSSSVKSAIPPEEVRYAFEGIDLGKSKIEISSEGSKNHPKNEHKDITSK